jgi:hypothetical protein
VIGAASAPGAGSRFWFEIPLAPASNPAVARKAPAGHLAAAVAAPRPQRVGGGRG